MRAHEVTTYMMTRKCLDTDKGKALANQEFPYILDTIYKDIMYNAELNRRKFIYTQNKKCSEGDDTYHIWYLNTLEGLLMNQLKEDGYKVESMIYQSNIDEYGIYSSPCLKIIIEW